MTMNQVVFGLACGSMRAPRAKASSETTPRASAWMAWPVTPVVPGGPSGRRWPTPKRRISIGIASPSRLRRAVACRSASSATRRRRPPRRRIVASGSANFCFVK